MTKLRDFVLRDHRYVLLGTSAVAFLGMLLSSSPRPAMSFLARAFTVELVMYYLLVAWLVVSAVALVFKLSHWRTYDQTSPFVRPAARRALRYGSYVVWALVLVLAVDRWAMGVASAWQAAAASSARPQEDMLQGILYILQHDHQTFTTGLVTTVELAVFGTILAFFLALLLVFCRIQTIDRPDNDFVRFWKKLGSGFAKAYSTVIRGTPMMIQAMIIYPAIFALFRGTGMTTTEINGLWTPFLGGLVTVTLNSTAYMMEVLRGGIESVDKGQTEAARSLGLSQWQAMRKVVFPQGIKFAIPGLSNELIINIKDSSVLSVIGTFELAFASTTATGVYYNQLQPSLISAVVYLFLTMVASWLLGKFAKHFDVKPEPVGSTSDKNLVGEE
ncbi:amino acid ABC transporter permease [Thermophilibacter provencensis]|uniref:Amino acid ABC transporter permease n=1 Tax=Thermophilibacter provencensis TaxID=1852386 RepID=A0ABT7V257_9ACTN|nr:amino acid ABC transporter permease [Thermophilibacter provencensis]MDM8270688.1 amino acid ABC transporter permease [Thermophilibacter provencensis]